MKVVDGCTDREERRRESIAEQVQASVRASGPGQQYDSVVVVGDAGVSRACLVSRLAGHPRFEAQVVVAGRAPLESRRLTDGVSLRGFGVDVMSYATGLDHSELVERFTGGGAPAARTQVAMRVRMDDTVRIGRVHRWQGGEHFERPIVYGARNSRTVAQLEACWPTHVSYLDEQPTCLEEARSLATGTRPLIVNTSRNTRLLGNFTPAGEWAIVAAQVPLRPRVKGLSRHVQPGTTIAPLISRDGAVDVGYITPFSDPMSPTASWYGILARPVRVAGLDRENEPMTLMRELSRLVDALGFDEVDPAETAFAGIAPGNGWTPPRSQDVLPGTLELKPLVSSGLPAYYADGMTTGSLGAVVAADAIAAGFDPFDACRRALSKFRRYNKMLRIEMTTFSPLVATAMDPIGGAALWYPHSHSIDMWASKT